MNLVSTKKICNHCALDILPRFDYVTDGSNDFHWDCWDKVQALPQNQQPTVAELADATDLKSVGVTHKGSNPFSGTKRKFLACINRRREMHINQLFDELKLEGKEFDDWTLDVNPLSDKETQIVFARVGSKYGWTDPVLFMTFGNNETEGILGTVKQVLTLWAKALYKDESRTMVSAGTL